MEEPNKQASDRGEMSLSLLLMFSTSLNRDHSGADLLNAAISSPKGPLSDSVMQHGCNTLVNPLISIILSNTSISSPLERKSFSSSSNDIANFFIFSRLDGLNIAFDSCAVSTVRYNDAHLITAILRTSVKGIESCD